MNVNVALECPKLLLRILVVSCCCCVFRYYIKILQ